MTSFEVSDLLPLLSRPLCSPPVPVRSGSALSFKRLSSALFPSNLLDTHGAHSISFSFFPRLCASSRGRMGALGPCPRGGELVAAAGTSLAPSARGPVQMCPRAVRAFPLLPCLPPTATPPRRYRTPSPSSVMRQPSPDVAAFLAECDLTLAYVARELGLQPGRPLADGAPSPPYSTLIRRIASPGSYTEPDMTFHRLWVLVSPPSSVGRSALAAPSPFPPTSFCLLPLLAPTCASTLTPEPLCS